MKKLYNEPEMNISMFEVENVVTGSGTEPAPDVVTAESKAKAKLGTGESNTVVLTW